MNSLTIFTPTFNRKHTLINTYKSLLNQTNKNFVWLIVDDGSIDGTNLLVDQWKKDNFISIMYILKENGGKHTAYNTAIDICNTEYFFMSLDSDDMLKEDAVEFIYSILEKNPNCDGMATPWENINENVSQKKLNLSKLKNYSISDAYKKNMVDVELSYILKTDKLKKFKFPVLKNEKFFTEAFLYYQMDFNIIWTNKYTKYGCYLDEGYSSDKKIFKKYPGSWYYYNKLRAKYNKSLILKIKYIVYMISFGRMFGEKKIIKNSPYKFLTILLYPFGVLGQIYLNKE